MKGIAFTLIILIALVPIVSLLLLDISQASGRTQIVNSIRVSQLENMYGATLNDYSKFLTISLSRSTASTVDYVILSGVGVDDARVRLKELVTNGSIYGTPQALMENSTFNDW